MYTRYMFLAVLTIVVSYETWENKSTEIHPLPTLFLNAKKYEEELVDHLTLHKELVLNYTQSIKGDYARFLISTFMIHCPNIPLCYDDGRFYNNYSFLSERKRQFSVCPPCSCADDCERKHDCCISRYISQRNTTSDKGDHIGLQPESNMPPLICKRTQIGAFNFGVSRQLPLALHQIITHCPSRPGSIIWRKCRKLLSTDELKNEKLHRPVTSSKTNESYQNEYCATCFGEKRDNLFPWTRVLFEKTKDNMDKAGDPFQRAYEGESMISYEPAAFLKNGIKCKLPRVRKCNVTGSWARYDERLIWACEKIPFTVPFSYFGDFYKNIFCAVCNAFIFKIDIFSVPEIDFFFEQNRVLKLPYLGVSAEVLRFPKPMVVRDYTIENRCVNEEIFSPILKQCLPVVCDFGYIQQGPKCQSISSSLCVTVMKLYAAVCTKESDDSVLFHKMRTNDAGLINDIKIHLIEHMHLHEVSFTFKMFYTVMPSSNELCYPFMVYFYHGILVNTVVMINFYQTFLKNMSFNDKFELRHTQFRLLGKYDHLISEKAYLKDGYVGKQSYFPWNICHLTDKNHCPRIYLPNSYHINFTLFETCISEYDVCFESHLVRKDDKGIFLCLDVYKQIIDEYVRKLNAGVSAETYLSVVSLSVSSFCCFLTVTKYLVIHDTLCLSLKLKMALSLSLFLANTLYTSSRFFTSRYPFCIVFGILSHYLWLLVLGFMSILSFDLFISIFGSFTLKGNGAFLAYIISNLTVSIIVVTVHIRLSFESSEGCSVGYSKTTCFIENGELQVFTLVLPIVLMVVLNTAFFMTTAYCIRKRVIIGKSREKLLLKVILKISIVTAVAWIFGFLFRLIEEPFFAHVHAVFSGCIGVFIFFSF